MKEIYTAPDMEIMSFESEDVIRTSPPANFDPDNPQVPEFGQ